jgi:hypothetical protein
MAIELYLVKFLVGEEGTPGAPILHVSAAVDAPTGQLTGQAEITQAIAPPEGIIRINDLHGRIHTLTIEPPLRVVTLTGSYVCQFPPPAIGQATTTFSATLILAKDKWEGRGSFRYGNAEVDDVPVVPAKE